MKKMDQLMKQSVDAAPAPERASSLLKSRILTKLINLEQTEGPLRVLSANRSQGDALCIFEQIVAAMPMRCLSGSASRMRSSWRVTG